MKRLLWLLLVLLCLSGCYPKTANVSQTEQPAPPVVAMSSPEISTPNHATTEPLSSTEPVLTEPAPAEPATTEPAPTEPETTEPNATEPAPTQPAATEPKPTEPAPPQPTTTEPKPTEPEPEPPDYQYGDTTPTWRPELAEGYPADSTCDAALLLEKWMAVEGLTMADLNERDCRQLILVAAQPADGVATDTVCYERSGDGSFVPVEGLARMSGFVGKNGIMHDRRRDTNTSPAGLWAIGMAFGNEEPPNNLKLPWRQVTPNSDWVCDDQSPYFNTWQERDDPSLIPWSEDVEHLEDYPTQYAWACVIEFNRPPDVVPERGCAIFLHCSKGGTGGCVGLSREDMLSVLKWLDAEKNPYILITGSERS